MVASNNTNLFFPVLEVRSFKWVGRAMFLLEAWGESAALSSFKRLPASLCFMGQHYSNFCFSTHIFSNADLPSSRLWGCLRLFWAYPDNPGQSHLKTLNLIMDASPFCHVSYHTHRFLEVGWIDHYSVSHTCPVSHLSVGFLKDPS